MTNARGGREGCGIGVKKAPQGGLNANHFRLASDTNWRYFVKCSSMRVQVMCIRHVRMHMPQWLMSMWMAVLPHWHGFMRV
jgi:hypothetical protein